MKRGKNWVVNDLRVATLDSLFEICEWWNIEQRVENADPGRSRRTMCKVKGITLNYNASKMVNFEVIRDMNLIGNKGDELSGLNVHT